MNRYCAPRLTQIRNTYRYISSDMGAKIGSPNDHLGNDGWSLGLPKWQNGPQNAQKNMTYYLGKL